MPTSGTTYTFTGIPGWATAKNLYLWLYNDNDRKVEKEFVFSSEGGFHEQDHVTLSFQGVQEEANYTLIVFICDNSDGSWTVDDPSNLVIATSRLGVRQWAGYYTGETMTGYEIMTTDQTIALTPCLVNTDLVLKNPNGLIFAKQETYFLGFFPNTFNCFRGAPSDSVTGVIRGDLFELSVLCQGESSIALQMSFYDEDNNELFRTDPQRVALQSGVDMEWEIDVSAYPRHINVELSSLAGWSGLAPGTYDIYAQATAEGAIASDRSRAGSAVKYNSGVGNYLLNETLFAGRVRKTVSVEGTIDGRQITAICIPGPNDRFARVMTAEGVYYTFYSSETGAFSLDGGYIWTQDQDTLETAHYDKAAYAGKRTITITGGPGADDPELIEWLTGNATERPILGVTGISESSGALTWTDDIAGLDKYTTTTSGDYVSVSCPLDDRFPFNRIEEFTDADGNVFVKFPKLWMKWITTSSGDIDGFKVSDVQVDSSYFVPDAFLDPRDTTCNTYLDYFALGKYEASGSSSKLYSKSGQTCLTTMIRATARSAARAYGSSSDYYKGYQQLDFAQFTLYNILCMMYYRTANIQSVYGGRTGSGSISSWSGASVTGTCDGIAGLNGWNTTTDCVKMLGIENPYGNIWKWVDGCVLSGSAIYAHRLPQQFSDSTSSGSNLGFSRPTSDGYISVLRHGLSAENRSYVYAFEVAGSSSTYVGDYCWYDSGGYVPTVGGGWTTGASAGLWCLYGNNSIWDAVTNGGARLSFRPL